MHVSIVSFVSLRPKKAEKHRKLTKLTKLTEQKFNNIKNQNYYGSLYSNDRSGRFHRCIK